MREERAVEEHGRAAGRVDEVLVAATYPRAA